jgi:hypothetical protein
MNCRKLREEQNKREYEIKENVYEEKRMKYDIRREEAEGEYMKDRRKRI